MKPSISHFLYVGWLAMALSAPADIVWSGAMSHRAYHDVTVLDMNQDGANDFTFNLAEFNGGEYKEYFIDPVNGGIVVEQQPDFSNPISLAEETLISTTLSNTGLTWDLVWQTSETFIFGYGTVNGNPDYGGLYNREGYLGVSFEVEGATHYGWIQTSHDGSRASPDDQYLYVHGWAYESTPGVGIVAGAIPEPSTGVLTVGGSLALLMLARARRRGKHACVPRTVRAPREW